MKQSYWDNISEAYEAEIFSVAKHDRKGLVRNLITQYGSRSHTACDLGCGIGGFLEPLSEQFKEVLAVDLSAKNIARAQSEFSRLSNIAYRTADLANPRTRFPKTDFALCVNAILTPSLNIRSRMFDTLVRVLRPGAHLALVVPALESFLLTDYRLIEWNVRDGMKPSTAVRAGFRPHRKTDNPRIHEGVVDIDDVPTKHFLKEELMAILQHRKLAVLDIQKIEYPWKTEFARPPRWMKDPYPWDWLFVAQKEKRKTHEILHHD